jgi:hypothetical protein
MRTVKPECASEVSWVSYFILMDIRFEPLQLRF